jgi:endogenous inhibitor of DNA gyrase (YacG/DUF329 family)
MIPCRTCGRPVDPRPGGPGRLRRYCATCRRPRGGRRPRLLELPAACRTCGVALELRPGPGRHRLYCSSACAERYRRPRPPAAAACGVCGIPITQPHSHRRRYCAGCRKRRDRFPRARCACGGLKSYGSRQCRACFNRSMRPTRSCAWCGRAFWRKAKSNDARKFCSRQCAGRRKRSPERDVDVRAFRIEIARALNAAFSDDRPPAPRLCACGGTITRPRGLICRACAGAAVAASRRAEWSVDQAIGIDHVCPNCGKDFKGRRGEIYCSFRCQRRYSHAAVRGADHDRYPRIGHLPVTERNDVAALMALVRAANRRLHGRPSSKRAELRGIP